MIELIFVAAIWAIFITAYVKHKRKVKEFEKTNPDFLVKQTIMYLIQRRLGRF